MNSADPSVGEQGEEFIPSGGIGRLARDGQAFHSLLEALQKIEENQTLLIRRGEPAAVLETREDAPRVVVLNAELGGEKRSAPAPEMRLDTQGEAPRYAADWMLTGPASALPEAFQVFRSAARRHFGGSLAGRLVVSAGMGGMGGAQALAVALNGGAFLGIDADSARIKRRQKAGFCEVMVNNLDEALRILKNSVRRREPASVGLIGNAAEVLPELAERGVLPDLLTDQTPADDLSGGYIPRGIAVADALEIQRSDSNAHRERALDSIAAQARAMLELKRLGAIVFEFGNGIRAQALARGVAEAGEIPDFISEYLLGDLAQGRGLLTVMALSGDLADLAPVDAACLDLFRQSEPSGELSDWIAVARKRPTPGLPARSLWMTAAEGAKLGKAINDAVGNGAIKAPVAVGRSIYVGASSEPVATVLKPPGSSASAIAEDGALSDWPSLAALLQASSGASWLGVQAGSGWGNVHTRLHFAAIAEGTPASARRIARVFASDLANSFPGGAAPFAS
jgi:urocanate hydratase